MKFLKPYVDDILLIKNGIPVIESVESYLSGKDTLTIMRTGGGKTLIYSAAALLSNRLTVVFSPLKSLMDDQLVSKNLCFILF